MDRREVVQQENADTGVIVARLQVDDLHEGHKQLFDTVIKAHERVIVFLGLSPAKCTYNNALDFESRKRMVNRHYPDVIVLYIKDMHSDKLWSKNLDNQINDVIGPNHTSKLYGGRDSFIKHYSGKFETEELKQEVFISGTVLRKKLAIQSRGTVDFNSGAIFSVMNQFSNALPTVDVAIFNEDYSEILLGRKDNEDKYRFIGGFVDAGETYEQAARREAKEESSLEITDPEYVCSVVIDDWRYRRERNKITTSLFKCKKMFGSPEPGDDILEVRWFKFNGDIMEQLVDNHKELLEILLVKA